MNKIYEANVINIGGRNGEIYSQEKELLYNVAAPGSGIDKATNPEELFAATYSTCFNGALELVKSRKNIDNYTSVKANVSLLNNGDDDFSIEVSLEVFIENISREEAIRLVEEADQVCPYSKALRGNVAVTLKISDRDF
ncbi:Ohr family peroxiredoxin [Enterococcus faecium]|uniref:Ohr family peroxiredoxin n=1 Tax=Enterococcus faecium TaxID=1352 RepID=UPI00241432F6|nr:Ohr family peroxiredoxin [Enterococcus faecium]MDG4589157.1 Ohr family peroxiredoxin [Enterococcus faecium]